MVRKKFSFISHTFNLQHSANMHTLVFFVLATSTCLAYYGGYDSRNLIVREEPQDEMGGELVECPVCLGARNGEWLPSNEVCPIMRGNKRYKRCPRGTYVNEVCDNRLDCYRGPREQCTEKMDFDVYGQKCAPGYYCNKYLGVCTGLEYNVDSKTQWLLNPNRRYPLRARRAA
ncbi:uncharacterized protein LOC114352600 isoform X1 [Ostrinia furnacalis]|uniref:uncharacterized protein LOC114352600 isoform X1 n=2 Tax=Ostrinia TaxID=29056 RepID=UPI00104008DA|nr:uncharacterized protein LOC114352600 isoform X1 [Ostrinia furnacalis]